MRAPSTAVPRPYGRVVGTPGRGLLAGDVHGSAGDVSAGVAGERQTASVLDALAARPGGPWVFHDLTMPSPRLRANIDHAVVYGSHVWLIDSKMWRSGFYWTVDGVVVRWGARVPGGSGDTLRMADRLVTGMLRNKVNRVDGVGSAPGAGFTVHRPVLAVWAPSGSHRLWAVRPPGVDVVAGHRLGRWLRRQFKQVDRADGAAAGFADPTITDALTALTPTT